MKAIFAGSFDPFTIGHRSIVERALPMFDEVVIAIGENEHKRCEWTVEQRRVAIARLFKEEPKVSIAVYRGLTASFAMEIGAGVLLRGVRSISDFEYERNLADTNRAISGIETVFLLCEPEYSFISSSMVRELIHNGFDAKKYIAGDFPDIN
ncbi:MAG: pantetheine-phosphate adenylyltransferase [Muribaculaceae bacterium]|nr:pantetheine-phosphate adenylyltransferase [Muribaculaceae bacterium]MDE6399605.1 pantetheine-phosphate adenylyltransferase [Muribaculaceae bacterium]MDE6534192.1 pantetheine-phosphate adenylyltransferase [Muribaculaceae bacterium]